MYNTRKLLLPLIDAHYDDLTLEELCEEYKIKADARILASAYDKIYRLAIVINNNYWGLTEADYASHCLERLDFCLRTYDIRPNRKAKFITYFCKVYGNKLREETEALNRKKRKCILTSINELINVGVEDTYNLIELLLPNTLTEKEYRLCMLESEGYDKQYCADALGVSRMTISNLEKSLRIKLADL